MEIALLPKSGIKIKGKKASLTVDGVDKASSDAVLALAKSANELSTSEESVLIFSVGEFEVAGIKVTGIRSESGMVYSILVDGISVVIGKLDALEKLHSKLQEHNIVIVDCEEEGNASFITALASNAVVCYGTKANVIAASFGKDSVKTQNKYSGTKDKLPEELETILLQ